MVRLDEIDRQILYQLAEDARRTSAPGIAEEVEVSAGTIRNRIERLEDDEILTGYHAAIDYELADNNLKNLLICNVPITERTHLAQQALAISGVVHIRELLSGYGNLHITTVGADTEDLSRISQKLSLLGIDIQEENLVRREQTGPYEPYGPEEHRTKPSATDFINLSEEVEVVNLTVVENAAIEGLTLQEANTEGLLGDDILIVAIERNNSLLMPKGQTRIEAGDHVTLFRQEEMTDNFLHHFIGSRRD